jgi:dephospho-CoA kinase
MRSCTFGVVVVSAPAEMQRARALGRPGMTEESAALRRRSLRRRETILRPVRSHARAIVKGASSITGPGPERGSRKSEVKVTV